MLNSTEQKCISFFFVNNLKINFKKVTNTSKRGSETNSNDNNKIITNEIKNNFSSPLLDVNLLNNWAEFIIETSLTQTYLVQLFFRILKKNSFCHQ